VFLKGNKEDTRIQCLPKMVAQNSKMDAGPIKPLQSVDAAEDTGNVAPQQAGGDKDGRTGRVQAPVAPGSTPPAAWDTPSSEEVEQTKRPVAGEAGGHRDGTWAEEPCTGWGGPAVGSRPQAVLEVLVDSQDKEQGGPKSTESEMLVAPASKRRDSVPAPSLGLADIHVLSWGHKGQLKKGSGPKELASAQQQREKLSVPSSAHNLSSGQYFLLNRPLQVWLHRIQEVSRQKYRVLSQPQCTHLQACNAMPLLPLHTRQSEGRSTKHSLPCSNAWLSH
jgi:hypothetical protein